MVVDSTVVDSMVASSRNDARSLDGRIAVVTGAAQGLGLGIAEQLATEGARVFMADLQFGKAEAASQDLNAQGFNTSAARLDVTDSAEVNKFFETIAEDQGGKDQGAKEQGRVDILVNSAGLGQDVCSVLDLSDQQWKRVIEVNLTGTFHTCRAAGRIMARQESGAIVNLASINGQSPAALVAAYNAAKAGVISLTKTLALELAPYGVMVNAVSPGPVYTDFNRKVMAQRSESLGISEEEMVERVRKAVPLGRWGEPVDIARAVSFLCSPAASWITGEVLRVSGGLVGVSAAPPKVVRK